MAWPVVVVDSGGLPVTESDSEFATPYEIAENGFGTPITFIDSFGLPARGGGVARPSAPSIAYVTPVTNPPSFDIGLDVISDAPKAVAVGDFIELWIDGALNVTSSALVSADIANASLTLMEN